MCQFTAIARTSSNALRLSMARKLLPATRLEKTPSICPRDGPILASWTPLKPLGPSQQHYRNPLWVIGPPLCRETPASRTAIRLIAVVFFIFSLARQHKKRNKFSSCIFSRRKFFRAGKVNALVWAPDMFFVDFLPHVMLLSVIFKPSFFYSNSFIYSLNIVSFTLFTFPSASSWIFLL